MAINLGLNIITNVKTNHTVNVAASAGVTLTSISSNNINVVKRLTVSATENVTKELCTITFTASNGFYYSNEPTFVNNFTNGDLIVTSTTTENSLNQTITKTFTISAVANVNTVFNELSFIEEVEEVSSRGTFDSTTSVLLVDNIEFVQIDAINFDTSTVDPNGEVRTLTVLGAQNSVFTTTLTRSSDSKTYDFTSNTFTTSSTNTGTKTINSSGKSEISVTIPTSSVLETYTVQTVAGNLTNLSTNLQNSSSQKTNVFTFNQKNNVTVTFTCVSADNSYTGGNGSLPSSTAITGPNGTQADELYYIELEPKLNTKAFKKAREIQLTDFESRTTSTTSGATSSTSVTLSSANSKILIGMTVTGSGISNSVTVASVNGAAITLSGSPGGTIADGTTLTFAGGGAEYIATNTGLIFSLASTVNDELIADLVINDVNKTANANTGSNSITLQTNTDLDDAVGAVVGIYKNVSTIKDGANAEGITVIGVDSSQSAITINAERTIRQGQVLTFTSAGRVAEISFQLTIIQFPTENTTVNLNLDNFLTIDPLWA